MLNLKSAISEATTTQNNNKTPNNQSMLLANIHSTGKKEASQNIHFKIS
jgi:hypothetical protein